MQSVNAVFNNPLLMDQIIKFSIYEPNGKIISIANVVAIRLVNKIFLRSTSRALKKSGDWIIRLKIGSVYSIKKSQQTGKTKYIETQEDVLKKFISVFSISTRSTDSVLPMYLWIDQVYLTRENSKCLLNLLEEFSDITCALQITYPIDGGSLNLTCNNLNFPILQTLEFKFEEWMNPGTYESKYVPPGDNANGLNFLQHILKNSNNLNRLQLMIEDFQVVNFGSISLPESIKYLYLNHALTDNNLDLIIKNHLSNLTHLVFRITKQREVSLMYKILQTFKKQITRLCVKVTCPSRVEEVPICIELPVMEKLKRFKLFGGQNDLVPEIKHVSPTLLPNITQLTLENSGEREIVDWGKVSRFDNVKIFKVSLHCSSSYLTVSPNEQILKGIITSFPNIEYVRLKISSNDTSGLKFLFRHFTCLKKLRLDFDICDRYENEAHKLVAVLLGISLEQATAMVNKTTENVTVQVDNPDSIMNLTELKFLTLGAQDVYNFERNEEDALCLNILTKYGFSKMPQLVKTKFLGGFMPSKLGALHSWWW